MMLGQSLFTEDSPDGAVEEIQSILRRLKDFLTGFYGK
jgi:hypothetical protein